jgi:hypothetical protein
MVYFPQSSIVFFNRKEDPMAERTYEKGATPPSDVEFIPIEQARMMGRSARLDPKLHAYYEEIIHEVGDKAARMKMPMGVSYITMKNRLLRVAQTMGADLTVRKAGTSVVFWKATPEELEEKEKVVRRLQGARRGRPAGRRRG